MNKAEKKAFEMIGGMLNSLEQDRAEIARRKARAPMKPSKPQSSCDIGLFSDDSKQTDLVEYYLAAKRKDQQS
jgi:hypothetical protein